MGISCEKYNRKKIFVGEYGIDFVWLESVFPYSFAYFSNSVGGKIIFLNACEGLYSYNSTKG